jgi:predicted RNase H-like nuclease (RuvC/YqgF family)
VQTAQTDQPAGTPGEETTAPEPKIPAAVPRSRTDSPAISRAVDEVRQIVESLEQALEQMEEVRELVELADRQKSADEREIESLRRALQKIQQPRGHKDIQHEHGGD